MAFSDAARNAARDGITDLAVYASLHTADPGATGANELSGGSPAYARQPVTLTPTGAGTANIATTATFDIPAGTTPSYAGLWSAATGGTFYGSDALDNPEPYTGQGVYDLTAYTVTINAV